MKTGRQPPASRIRRLLLLVALGAVGLLVIGAGWQGWEGRNRCAAGVEKHGPRHECVGVTDGEYVFAAGLEGVFDKIHQENQQVAASASGAQHESYVSIAYLLPMTLERSDISTLDSVRRELIGAYITQHEANLAQDARPLIRVLLANVGSKAEQWEPVVEQLKDLRNSANLVAVAGIGQTLDGTDKAIEALRKAPAPIPVVGSTITGDNLTGREGLVRVAPTNSDEARAFVAYAKRHRDWHTVMLVQDINPKDPYATTLGEQFQLALKGSRIRLVGQIEEYDSSLRGYASRFPQMGANICIHKPDLVYFAGRGTHLAPFVAALAGRTCQHDHTVAVFTGDDANQLESRDDFRDHLSERLMVGYTGLAHPDAWDHDPKAFSAETVKRFQGGGTFKSSFPTESLDDGQAIMGHDALMATVAAVRQAADEQGNGVTPEAVINQLKSLHTGQRVGGASGWISLCNNGDPDNKGIPILEFLPADIDASTGVRFLELSSPTGSPPTDPLPGAASDC